MAKFKKEYDNGVIKSTLTFRGRDFILTMGNWKDGVRTSLEKCLSVQVAGVYQDNESIDEIESIVDQLDFGDDDEIEDALESLSYYE